MHWDESVMLRGATQFRPLRGALWRSCYGERTVDVSIPAGRAVFALCAGARLQPMARLSAPAGTELLLLRYRGISAYFSPLAGKCQAVKGLLWAVMEGVILSRSPRS